MSTFSFSVLGPIDPDQVGRTLTHEHVSMTFEFSYRDPQDFDKHLIESSWTLQNNGWIQQWP